MKKTKLTQKQKADYYDKVSKKAQFDLSVIYYALVHGAFVKTNYGKGYRKVEVYGVHFGQQRLLSYGTEYLDFNEFGEEWALHPEDLVD